MTPHAIWFGPADHPLAGYLHLPDGPPVGGVLVCAPFGYESTASHRTLRRLGDRLARSGRLVLRFDYAATGASAGTGHEPDLLARWQGAWRPVWPSYAERGSRGRPSSGCASERRWRARWPPATTTSARSCSGRR